MSELQNFKLLGIALAIGLLVGLERGWQNRNLDEGLRVAGLRTYGLISLFGALCALIAQQISPLFIGFALIATASILLIAYSKSTDHLEDFSITSMIASLVTFILGALVIFGQIALACATAVIVTTLLSVKPLLHGWLKKLEQHELNATLQLLLISVVMLPVLPNTGYGPGAVFNPYQIWWMVVLIAGVSYLGYFAIKITGDRHGPVLTGALGGLVSSTVVTLNLSRLSKLYPNDQNALAAGILTACATMFARTLLLVFIMNSSLGKALLPSLLTMSLCAYLMAFLLWRFAHDFTEKAPTNLTNPFQLGMALKFGIFLVAILLLSHVFKEYFGDLGTYSLATISGFADVDPLVLSMSRMSLSGLNLGVAGNAILIAVIVNSAVKSMFSFVFGDPKLGVRVAGVSLLSIGAGLAITRMLACLP